MSILYLNTETTDLIPKNNNKYVNPKKYKLYPRIIELNWIIMDKDMVKQTSNKNKILDKNYDDVSNILMKLNDDIHKFKVKKIVGYSVLFHYHIIISEAYRYKNKKLLAKLDIINFKPKIKPVCVMEMAMKYLDITNLKYPKLDELYFIFFKKENNKKVKKIIQCYYILKKNKDKEELLKKYKNKYIEYIEKQKN